MKVVVGLIAALFPAVAAGADAGTLVDRVVAVVDDDPILLSEVEQVLAVGAVTPREGESRRELERRVLDSLIEARLRWHEVDRHGLAELRAEEVDAQVEALRASFSDAAAFEARLAEVGLDPESLRQLFARQLLVRSYVDDLLGARVFVGLEDIRRHYDTELVPSLEERGEAIPPFDEVREAIRATLRQQRLTQEIVRWTEELRRRADVLDYLDRRQAELPPVVARQGESD